MQIRVKHAFGAGRPAGKSIKLAHDKSINLISPRLQLINWPQNAAGRQCSETIFRFC